VGIVVYSFVLFFIYYFLLLFYTPEYLFIHFLIYIIIYSYKYYFQVESGVRVKESYVSGKLGPLKIPLSTVKTFSRALLISYLDEDLLIARNQYGGSPQVPIKTY
jgi:hypothetical protein